ncbi:Synaptonemal complex protein 2-like, partial [Tinamus guttatus]
LESLLTDAFRGKGFQKINELFQEKEIEPPQKYSESLFNQLDKALRKAMRQNMFLQELDKNEFQNVSLLLKCIQLYLKSDLQEGESLFIEQGLVQKMRLLALLGCFLTNSFNFYMVSWFERARSSVILTDPNENKILMILLEDFFDCALVICRCSDEGKKELVNLFLPELGHLVTEANICCALRQEALRTLNSILDSVPREERKKFPLSEEICLLTKDLAKTILDVGDYDLQVALSEALCRLMTKKWRDDLVHHWFEDNYLAEAFKEIKDREFETDCRKFLNQLNERLGGERRVYSFPCISAFADMNEVKKPSDEKLEEFWIDFNAGSHSVTFYVDSSEGALWDSVRLSKEEVSSYSLREEDGEKTVKIYMKIPAIINKNEVTKIKISFSAKFEILGVLKKVLGDEKMMITLHQQINLAEEEPVRAGEQTKQNEAESSQRVLIIAPEGEVVVFLPPSAEKPKAPSPRMKAKPR